MASATQVTAKTEDTKESLRTRAVKHGLTAKLYTNTVLQGEDQAAYDQMLKSLLAEATLGTTKSWRKPSGKCNEHPTSKPEHLTPV
jgi:hypothetical protein